MNDNTCANGCDRPIYNQKRQLCEPCYRRVLANATATRRVKVVEKVCCRCGETKPATEFYGDSRRADGLTGACKICKDATKTAQRKERQRQGRIELESKECATCERFLPSDCFRTNNNHEDGYELSCRECMSRRSPEDFAIWDAERERDAALLALGMKFCRRCKTPKPLADFAKLHTSHDGHQYKCRECGSAYDKASRDIEKERGWRNPERHCDYERKRYSHKKNPDGAVELVKRLIVAERDEWICQICGDPIDPNATYKMPDGKSNNPEYLNIDHWVPLTRGGDHTYDNCYATHARCNNGKKNKMPDTPAPVLAAA